MEKKIAAALLSKINKIESEVCDYIDAIKPIISNVEYGLNNRINNIEPVINNVNVNGGIKAVINQNGHFSIVDLAGKEHDFGYIIGKTVKGDPGRPGKSIQGDPGRPGRPGKSMQGDPGKPGKPGKSIKGDPGKDAPVIEEIKNLGNGKLLFIMSDGEEFVVTGLPVGGSAGGGGGGLGRVIGIEDRISVQNRNVIDISEEYAGQTSITTVGNIVQRASYTNQTSILITHNLGVKPFVQLIDASGNVASANVKHAVDKKSFTVTFSSSRSGEILYKG